MKRFKRPPPKESAPVACTTRELRVPPGPLGLRFTAAPGVGPCVAATLPHCRLPPECLPLGEHVTAVDGRSTRDLTPAQLCTLLDAGAARERQLTLITPPVPWASAAAADAADTLDAPGFASTPPRASSLGDARAPPPPSSRESRHDVVQKLQRRSAASRWSMDEADAGGPLRPSLCVAPAASGPAAGKLLSGWLSKLATSKLAGWQRRYFVGAGHYLRYYASDAPDAALAGAIDLRDVIARAPEPLAGTDERARTACELRLEVADGGAVRLRAPSSAERDAWIDGLRTLQRIDAEARGSLSSRSVSTGSLLPPPPPRTARPRGQEGGCFGFCAAKVG